MSGRMTDLFARRPKLAYVLSLVVAICGGLCVCDIPVADYPEIAPPMVSVSTTYSGASPRVVSDTVATPIETEVNGVDNVDHFESTCNDSGAYSLYVTFKAGTDPDINLVNVQNAVKRAEPKLPGEVVQLGISVMKAPSDYMVRFGFTTDGTGISSQDLGSMVTKEIKESLQRIDGVSYVASSERGEYAMRVWLDSRRMDALGISVFDVKTAISQQNIQPAAGFVGNAFSSGFLNYKINVRGRLMTEEEFDSIVVKSDPATGARVLLSDVARCELGSKSYASQPRVNDRLTFFLSVYRDPKANTVTTARRCKEAVDDWMKRLPKGAECTVVLDNTLFTREMVGGIVKGAGMAALLLVAALLLLTGGLRISLAAMAVVAVSLLGGIAFMRLAGYSVNVLTAFGLVLSLGAVVGNFMTMVDCVLNGRSTLKGRATVTATVVVAGACYLPLAFHGGMLGMMYVRFSVTLLSAVIMSAILSCTLVPACSEQLFRHPAGRALVHGAGPWLLRIVSRPWLAAANGLAAHPILALVVLAALAGAGLSRMGRLSREFMPSEDRGFIKVEAELSEGSSIERTIDVIDRVHELVKTVPGVSVISSAAASSHVGKIGENHGEINLLLAPWRERDAKGQTLASVSEEVERRLAGISTSVFTLMYPAAINGLGNYGGVVAYLCALGSPEPSELAADAEAYAEKLRGSELVKSVVTTFSSATPQLFLDVDRDKAQALGIPVSTVFSTLQNKLASFYVNDFNIRGGAYQVVVQNDIALRGDIDDAMDIHFPGANGAMVPLSSFGRFDYMLGPRVIPRFNKLPAAGVVITPAEGVSSLAIVDMIEREPPDPAKYVLDWSTMTAQERASRGRMPLIVTISLLLAYLVLVARYESWRLPLPVLLPSLVACGGAATGLWLTHQSLSIYAQLGLMVLIELPMRFSMQMLDAVLGSEGDWQAIVRAGAAQAFQPVCVSVLSCIASLAALALATGVGAAAQRAIATTVIFGMTAYLLLGLPLVPALCLLVRRKRPFALGVRG